MNVCPEDEFRLPDPDATRALGRRLGAAAHGGEVLLLRGHLGAGKTCLTQGLALGLGVSPDAVVTSPTFTLHQQYFGRLRLDHIDLYRLSPGDDDQGDPLPASADRLHGVGLEDWLGDPEGVCAVEWPEVFDAYPSDALEIVLEAGADEVRRAVLRATGPVAKAWRERLLG